MDSKENNTEVDEERLHEITLEEFNEFEQAKTYEEKMRILFAHSQKNSKRIEIKRARTESQAKTQEQIEKEILELNRQFSEFLHTKGVTAKFRLAFNNMGESARKQHEEDAANYEAAKAQSAEDNKEFVEFLHTKGIKAKYRLVIENIKKGANAAPQSTASQIAKVRVQTQANIAYAHARAHTYAYNPYAPVVQVYSAKTLVDEFNAFLKAKGLDSQYTVVITQEE